MTKRREFAKQVMIEIYRRATRDGQTYCEECGVAVKHWHIDHIIPDGLVIDKSQPLTAEDGQLLCAGYRETCHGKKTAEQDVPAIAKAKRREAAHIGLKDEGRSGLEGRTPAQRRAAKDRRSAEANKFAMPPRRSLFIDDPSPRLTIAGPRKENAK